MQNSGSFFLGKPMFQLRTLEEIKKDIDNKDNQCVALAHCILHVVPGFRVRSFSVWATIEALVRGSFDDYESIVAAKLPHIFIDCKEAEKELESEIKDMFFYFVGKNIGFFTEVRAYTIRIRPEKDEIQYVPPFSKKQIPEIYEQAKPKTQEEPQKPKQEELSDPLPKEEPSSQPPAIQEEPPAPATAVVLEQEKQPSLPAPQKEVPQEKPKSTFPQFPTQKSPSIGIPKPGLMKTPAVNTQTEIKQEKEHMDDPIPKKEIEKKETASNTDIFPNTEAISSQVKNFNPNSYLPSGEEDSNPF